MIITLVLTVTFGPPCLCVCLCIRKLEPIAAGSHTYVVADRALNVHSKFVRVGGLCLGEVAHTAADVPLPTAANKRTCKYVEGAKWELDEDERVKIWSSIPHWK